MFYIDFLDHIALRVKDLKKSVEWYAKVLGLKKVQLKEWGEFPIFMLAGETGLALFPPKGDPPTSKGSYTFVDHFAFRVSNENFELAKQHLDECAVEYFFQDHIYFHSLYFQDLDGHDLELTTQVRPF